MTNASSVQSDLGGREDGHLGLVYFQDVYQTLVPNADPNLQPDNPGCLQLELGMAQYEIDQARDEHADKTGVFCKVIGVERALCQQLVMAIKPKYLQALWTPGTNKLTQTIPEIFYHLFSRYGDVTPQDLTDLTARVKILSFHPQEPVNTIFSEIDNLAKTLEYTNAKITFF